MSKTLRPAEPAVLSAPLAAPNQPKAEAAPPYYERHIFFCLNQRKGNEECCAQQHAEAGFDRCKSQVKAAGLSGPGQVRVNKAGCMDRCAAGPVAVVYPEGVWYTYVDASDIDEIVESHLKNGQIVTRLLIPAYLGR
ncbi:MAG: (2Fe-2S) ferredoxin domain-containing protein [Polaromonas sp.]|nr:(2Fe-2S) ferredoxin domain-containing protein [Polaromonas sp.]